jgi:hypothetical protein
MVNTAVVWCCPDYVTTAWYLYGAHTLAAILILVIFGPKNLVSQSLPRQLRRQESMQCLISP